MPSIASIPDRATYEAEWSQHETISSVGRHPIEREVWRYERRLRKPETLQQAKGNKGIHGAPPDNSTYRCVARCKRTGEQCRGWAMRGQRRCNKHYWAGSKKGRRATRAIGSPHYRLASLPHVYSKYLSQTLVEKMKEVTGAKDRLDMSEELDLLKVAALDIVQTYDAVASLSDEHRDAKVAAGVIMRDALEGIIAAADRVASIEAKRNDKVEVGSLHVIVNQIVEKAYERFGEKDIDAVKAFADDCRQIRLPSAAVKGTTITPDQDALDMSATIPK